LNQICNKYGHEIELIIIVKKKDFVFNSFIIKNATNLFRLNLLQAFFLVYNVEILMYADSKTIFRHSFILNIHKNELTN
jgi:hypothetical protein